MAKPSPIDPALPPVLDSEAIEEVMPMTVPDASNSGPPLLPGLIAASIWIAFVTTVSVPPSEAVTGRSRAEMMPVVTVLSRPSGLPTAITSCPTARSADVPSVATVRSFGGSDSWMTARSVVASVPTTVASYIRPSPSVTTIFCASATTWLFVRMRPAESRMTPEPAPLPAREENSMATTLGRAAAAAFSQSGVPVLFRETWVPDT